MYVNYGGERRIRRFLTTATAAVPASFLGRTKELDDIRALLNSRNTLALVNSEGGMGKTTLAAAYWKQYEDTYTHLAWLFCEKGILAAMRDQLPRPLGLIEEMNQYADNPDKQAAIIRDTMANLNGDCLLVLDNANEPEHILGFLQYMNGLGWHVLITSRCSKVLPEAQNEYPIASLPPDLAKTLFKNNYREDTTEFDALLDRFLTAVGYNTLCIDIFSKNLREGNPWGYSFEAFLGHLEHNGLILGENSFEIVTDYALNIRKEVKKSDQIIEALYNFSSLQPKETDLLIQFALLPAESHTPKILTELFGPTNRIGFKTQLDHLAQKGWISTDVKSYRISPVVQKIVLQKHADRLWVLGKHMVKKLNVIFEHEGYHSININIAAPYEALAFGLLGHLDIAKEELSMLYHRLWYYYLAIGNLAKAMDTATRLEQFSAKFDFKFDLAAAYERLGDTCTELGQLKRALIYFEKENKLFEALYTRLPNDIDIKNGMAISYEKLGNTFNTLGHYSQALVFFEKEQKLKEELYTSYPQIIRFKNGLAISYERLGETHAKLNNLEAALGFFEVENKLFLELSNANQTNISFKKGLAISYSKLGETYMTQGNLDQALAFFEQFNQLMKKLHLNYPQNVEFKYNYAISLKHMGQIYFRKTGIKSGMPYFKQALIQLNELYATTQTPRYYEEMRQLELMLKLNSGCLSVLRNVALLVMKIPFLRNKLEQMQKTVQQYLREEYHSTKGEP